MLRGNKLVKGYALLLTFILGLVFLSTRHPSPATDVHPQRTLHDLAAHMTPAYDHVTPAPDHVTPAHDHVTPAYDHVTPAYDHVTPAHDHVAPAHDHVVYRPETFPHLTEHMGVPVDGSPRVIPAPQQKPKRKSTLPAPKDPWVGVRTPLFFYCYSSYLDDRFAPQVVVNAVGDKEGNFSCNVEYMSSNWTVANWFVKPEGRIASCEKIYGMGMCSWTLHCKAPDHAVRVLSVTVYNLGKTNDVLCKMPVVLPTRPETKRELGVCVPPIYNIPRCDICQQQNVSRHLVAWMEMQRMLGVSAVMIYNHSMDDDTARILEYYVQKGFVSVRYEGPVPGHDLKLPTSVVINDCLYRNMHSFKKLMMIDLDEFIIPRTMVNLVQLTKSLALQNKVPYEGSDFMFANTLFYKDFKTVDTAQSEKFTILRHRHRTEPQPFPGSCKSIIDPQTCKHAIAHLCGRYASNAKVSKVWVDPRSAILHHYKDCTGSWWRMGRSCEEEFRGMVQDDIMMLYEEALKERVNAVEQDMEGFL